MTRTFDPADAQLQTQTLLEKIQSYTGPPISVMEVCGTHTVAVARMGLRPLLPQGVKLISGPGCPVCVTPVETFDKAIYLVEKGVILATYGDAMRVPGTRTTLADARANGGRVEPVYSALDAVKLAKANPDDQVVFLGLGFETTSPTAAHAIMVAGRENLENFSVLCAHKALLPAMEALVADPQMEIGAFLCPGHATMVIGSDVYKPFCEAHRLPCVVTGFEAQDVLLGLLWILRQAKEGRAEVENAYPRAVDAQGNVGAMKMLATVFRPADARFRGIGVLPGGGYELKEEFAHFDAETRFLAGVEVESREPAGCMCAEVLRGRIEPSQCPLFAKTCTAENPVGACMVSSEGACGAHYRYRGV